MKLTVTEIERTFIVAALMAYADAPDSPCVEIAQRLGQIDTTDDGPEITILRPESETK
jgi:hypothetical protein